MRSPKYPLHPTSTESSASTMLATAASMAALPVPDTGIVTGFSVCQTYFSSDCTSFISSMNVGSR